MSSVPCRTALRCFDSFGMEETLPSITPMVVIRLSNRQDVARNDEIRAMHSLKTSLTISPVKRAYRHKLSNCRQSGNWPETAFEELRALVAFEEHGGIYENAQ